MNLDNFERIAGTDDLTKYEHPVEHVTAYEFHGYENDPILYIHRISPGWMARLCTNGSFTQMKASQQDFERALSDGKRLLGAFGVKE